MPSTNDDIFIESESSYRPPPVADQQQNIVQEIKKSVVNKPTAKNFATAAANSFSSAPTTFGFSNAPTSFTSAPPNFDSTVTTSLPPTTAEVEPPSKYYTPPFLEPAYNLEKDDNFLDAPKTNERRQLDSSLSLPNQQPRYDFQAFDSILKAVRKASRDDYDFSKYIRNKQQNQQGVQRQTTARPTSRPAAKPTVGRQNFIQPAVQNPTGFRLPAVATTRAPITNRVAAPTRATTRFTTRTTPTTRAPTTRAAITTKRPVVAAPRVGTAAIGPSKPFANSQAIVKPSRDLQPPFEDFKKQDSVTLGPPIYYEWKANIPSIDLQPPFEDNDPLDVSASGDVIGAHSQTTRSITEQALQNSFEKAIKKLLGTNYSVLKKELSIPEYQFPLEGEEVRTGYEKKEAVNSFQIKIPDKSTLQYSEWYGENPECPQCHPSFVKPGTCEPCVKIRE